MAPSGDHGAHDDHTTNGGHGEITSTENSPGEPDHGQSEPLNQTMIDHGLPIHNDSPGPKPGDASNGGPRPKPQAPSLVMKYVCIALVDQQRVQLIRL